MKFYLLGISVITKPGSSFTSRGFGMCDGPVTIETIAKWEQEALSEYREDYRNPVVLVFSFQELAG